MPNIAVAIINASTVLPDDLVAAAVPALQTQVSEHLAAVWGVDATLYFVPRGETPPKGAWWLSILDSSDQAGTRGYHDVTDDGLPLGKVFVVSDFMSGFNWTITASHELLEMLIDPYINKNVLVQHTPSESLLYAYEICDPCGLDQFGYEIDGVMVSDFVFPSWFEWFREPGSCQFDVTQHLTQPFELAEGGYISVYKISAGSGWEQLNTTPDTVLPRPAVGSRRERRHLRRNQWVRSVALTR